MGREIKFRAWDEIGEQWIYLDLSDLRSNQLERQGFNNLRVTNWCRWTGLKDKNGVEVYEGDILTNSQRKPRLVRTVAWTEGREPGGAPCWTGWEMDQLEASCWIVIGNTYENGDLLK